LNTDFFPRQQVVGVFRGFTEGGLEFHADLALPYRSDFHAIPMHGQFVLVQLETPDEAVLGRIASFSSEGKLSSGVGEEFNIRAVREERPVPDDLREQYLKYRVNIRVLGVIRRQDERILFIPSQRRLPHVGSPVAFPSSILLQHLAGHFDEGAPIGFLALGEYIYAGDNTNLERDAWMQIKQPEVLIKFPVTSLVSRRTFIFARAGFGKSNLNKFLFSKLYAKTPKVRKRGGREVPVGTVLFDPEGEYFWPDDKDRPGLCDVPHLKDHLVVFTSRRAPSPYYESFVAGGIKLDIRRLRPADVTSIAISPEKQDQQNVRKLAGLNQTNWSRLVEIIDRHGNSAPLDEIAQCLDLEPNRQEVEAIAARSNMTTIVRMLHDHRSQFIDLLLQALAAGKLCVVDISQMRQGQSLILTGIILQRIFDRNQEEFTAPEPRTIPTIAVIEEAQAVLNSRASGATPYVTWVKEGRKYDLGACLITQQPGSIPDEILSQGDNWFIFHLLSAGDLQNVRKANAHFSQDILSSILNEPIPGQGVFWSSSGGRPYPVSIRVLSFEAQYSVSDPDYNGEAIETYASRLRQQFERELREALEATSRDPQTENRERAHYGENQDEQDTYDSSETQHVDVLETYIRRAIKALREDSETISEIQGDGCPWGKLNGILRDNLPDWLDDKNQVAYQLVPRALDDIFGDQKRGAWGTFKTEWGSTWVCSPAPSSDTSKNDNHG